MSQLICRQWRNSRGPFPHLTYLTCLTLLTSAAAAFPTTTDVFISGTNGYHTYRIPAIVLTTNQTILAFCEGRKNSRSDTGKIDLLLKRSTDGGKTWSPQQIIWSDADNACGNPAPVVDQITGVIWLLMTWNLGGDGEREISNGTSKDTRRVFVTHSEDDGVTWSRPQEITTSVKKPDWRWYATGPANGIQLTRGPESARPRAQQRSGQPRAGNSLEPNSHQIPAVPADGHSPQIAAPRGEGEGIVRQPTSHRGRLVIPCNHTELNASKQPVSRSHVIYSDDQGKTWQLGGSDDELTNESTIVELADGSLMQNMRSYHKKNRRAVASSSDGGATWTHVKLDETLIEPVCQGSILRYSWPENGNRSRILFSNPASTKRENLTIRLSYDEAATWAISKVIHPGPSAYSCLTILPDKSIGCLFECGEKSAYEKISLARIPLNWLENDAPAK
jgi:sialidase-1